MFYLYQMFKKIIFIPLFFAVLFSCSPKKKEVDLIIYNGKIYSVDSAFTAYEAMAVSDGKVIELNTNTQILNKYISKNIENVFGKSVFPGFIDAHCHFLSYGLGLCQVNLVGTKSFDEVVSRVVNFNKNNTLYKNSLPNTRSKWIIGRGWDQNDWLIKQFPTKKILDSLFPHTPIILKRVDGHSALVNNEALRIANITKHSFVNGGQIVLSKGELTGILVDNAVDLVVNKIPPPSIEQIKQALLAAQENCLKVGLTTVDDAGLMKNDIDVIEELQKSGTLKMRIYAMLSDSMPNFNYYLNRGPYKTERLNVCSFKFYADGALGSRGACLLENYHDKPNWKGFLLNKKEHFVYYSKILAKKGFQMNTHCIGDSSDRVIAKIYNDALNSKPLSLNRWRIEHAQVVNKNDLKKFHNIIPSVQPTHATSDMYWAKDRLGETIVKTAYAYKDLLKSAGLLALGTDFPVEDISPFKTFYAAVARKDSNGFPENGFQIENALSRQETIRGMTIWAAYANFEDKEKGSLEKGKYADFIILSDDIMTCDINKVLTTYVISSYINGEKVYTLNK